MAIVREYACPTHGPFESKFSVCPHGCVDVSRIFTSPPATISRRTKNIDRTLVGMAADYKLSDISNRNGTLAASVPQFQPKPVPIPNENLVSQYMENQKKLFGGNIDRGSDGSYWASGMSWQAGTAKATGEGMKKFIGYENPAVAPRPIVQAAYGTKADLMKGST